MAVISLARPEPAQSGLQPFDAVRHMRQVADLIAEAFAGELDSGGLGMIQDMRVAAWLSTFLGSMASLAFFDEIVSGFVWLEQGKVVGNVTFQRADYGGLRWRISNVAVAATHRNQGIGRVLMLETIRAIAEQGGVWALLQVRTDNGIARHLYESLGFAAVCREGIWRLPTPTRLAQQAAGVALRELAPSAWRARLELARATRSPLATWLQPLNEAAFEVGPERRFGEWLGSISGLHSIQRWGAWDGDRLLGLVETTGGWLHDVHGLRLLVHPQARGQLETPLVAQGIRSLACDPARPIIAEHDGDHTEGVAALEALGFVPQRILLTMRRQISPKDAEI